LNKFYKNGTKKINKYVLEKYNNYVYNSFSKYLLTWSNRMRPALIRCYFESMERELTSIN
jgi:hypothetical protein